MDTTKQLIPPGNETETKLFDIWIKMLKTDQFSIDDNFFDIGGSSLKAVQMVVHINKAFDKKLTILDLLNYTNIKAIAEFLDASKEEDNSENELEEEDINFLDQTINIINDDEE